MPPAAKRYVVLHDFHTRVNDETGDEKAFAVGDVYDGPAERVAVLLTNHHGCDADGNHYHGPLVAEHDKPADAGKEN